MKRSKNKKQISLPLKVKRLEAKLKEYQTKFRNLMLARGCASQELLNSKHIPDYDYCALLKKLFWLDKKGEEVYDQNKMP